MDLATIVPGHGPVMHDKTYLEALAIVLESVDSQARVAYRSGMSVDSLRARIDISALGEKFAHGDRFIRANFDYMIGQLAIKRAWQELAGKMEPEGE